MTCSASHGSANLSREHSVAWAPWPIRGMLVIPFKDPGGVPTANVLRFLPEAIEVSPNP